MLVPWTPLTPSRRERAIRRIGVVLGCATAAALLLAAARQEPFDPSLVVAALLALLAAGLAGRPAPTALVEVGVDRSGVLTVRPAAARGGALDHGVRCVFAAPWLITLKRGTIYLPIWPDSVPGNTYRRLWVHIRWSSGRQPAVLPAGKAPGQPE